MTPELKTDIVILGAGIGGYEAFRTLSRLLRRYNIKKQITIVDQNNYFTFTPLLHEVASGAVEPTHATLPLQELVYKTPHKFLKTTVTKINPVQKIVTTSAGLMSYEFCVVALGSTTNYYGVPGAEKNAYHTRSLAGAMILRHNLIEKLESSQPEINIMVVGGGFTGVEVAGQLAYFARHDLAKLYPEKKIAITLVQTIGTLVPQLPLKAQQIIFKRLKKMGVKILLNTAVKEVKEKLVVIEPFQQTSRDSSTPARAFAQNDSPKKELVSDFTVWCAGFGNIANCFLEESFCATNHSIPTGPFLTHQTESSLYAIGDIAQVMNKNETKPLPQLGEVAYHEGRYVAEHIIATMRKKTLAPFYFKSKGTLMPIGDRYGVAIFGPVVISGLFAWWLRRTVYLMFMPGFLRKLKIVFDWTLHLFGFSYIIAVERNMEHGPKNN
ncbi:MAG: hypothetical protein EXS55_02285 [Candidatus Magasanikbacteria bacterium]|nr:hypothetical protein [Candidatus Magasanikbacteria bacterium]